MATAYLLAQVLLTFHPTTAGPLRFGVPLPRKELTRGLRLQSRNGARLQWRRLQAGQDPETNRVWVELSITGAAGTSRILAGGKPAVTLDAGPVVQRSLVRKRTENCTVWAGRWRWHPGGPNVGCGTPASATSWCAGCSTNATCRIPKRRSVRLASTPVARPAAKRLRPARR
ncbi:MAG: hypothetical protein ACYTKC_17580 [Planctomycetota bacterium]